MKKNDIVYLKTSQNKKSLISHKLKVLEEPIYSVFLGYFVEVLDIKTGKTHSLSMNKDYNTFEKDNQLELF